MSSQDVLSFVIIKELFHTVRSELHDISGAVRITDKVRLYTQLLVVVCRVAPQDVNDELLLWGRNLMNDLQRSLNHFYLFD